MSAEHPSLRAVVDRAVTLARHGLRPVFLPVAVPLAAIQVGFVVVQARLTDLLPASPLAPFAIIGLGVAALGVYLLAYSVLLVAATDALAGRAVAGGDAWLRLLHPRALLTLLSSYLIVAIGFLLCILPGLYAGLVLAFVVPAMIEERAFGVAALRRSVELAGFNPARRLAEDPRARLFVIGFVGWLLAYVLGLLVQLPSTAAMMVVALRGVADGGPPPDQQQLMAQLMWIQIPTAMLGAVVQAAVNLFVAYGVALVFFDVRRRQSGSDLEAELDALAAPPARPGWQT